MAEEQPKTSADVDKELERARATEKLLWEDYAQLTHELDERVAQRQPNLIAETRGRLLEIEKTLKFMERRLRALKSDHKKLKSEGDSAQ